MDRLDKFLCDSGAGSRSQVKELLKTGRVTVDGKPERTAAGKSMPEPIRFAWMGSALGAVGGQW